MMEVIMPSVDNIKNWVLAIGAIVGMASGAYSVIAKPIQESAKLTNLESRVAYLEPTLRQHETQIAVITSQLSNIKEDQSKILNVVLDIKRKL